MMKMRFKKTKMSLEKRALQAIVTNVDFLKVYQHIYRKGFLTTPYGDWLSETCIDYLKKYQTAPGKDIKDLFKSAVKSKRIPVPIADITADFLKEFDFDNVPTINHGYLATKTKDFFVIQLHKELLKKLELAIEEGNAELCEQAVRELRGVRLRTGQVCKPFEDKAKVRDAFLKEEKQLFKLSGDIGKMLNPQFKPKRFISLIGTAKRGKTWWLYRIAKTAKTFNNHVAVFAAGDEDEDSSIIRFACMLTGKNNDPEYTGPFACPVMDCAKNQNGECFKKCRRGKGQLPEIPKEEKARMKPEEILETKKSHRVCTVCRKKDPRNFEPAVWYKMKHVDHLAWQEAWRKFTRYNKLSPKSSLKLFTYSSNTLTVSEIERQLDAEEDIDGWVPTVIIVDYPDIMLSESKDTEKRHMENDKWTNLRRLSQDRSVCLIVVSQSNLGGYGSDSLDTTNVNEDRRKLDHVTGMYSINQTDEEKRKRIARIGPLVQRKGKFDTEYQVLVLQALEQGNPVIDSQYVYRMKKPKPDKK